RMLQKVDDLDQLVLSFVDAGDVVEGHFRVLLLVVAPRLALADAHDAADAAALLRGAPEHPDVKADEEKGRAEAEEKRHHGIVILLNRLCADLDAMIALKRVPN